MCDVILNFLFLTSSVDEYPYNGNAILTHITNKLWKESKNNKCKA